MVSLLGLCIIILFRYCNGQSSKRKTVSISTWCGFRAGGATGEMEGEKEKEKEKRKIERKEGHSYLWNGIFCILTALLSKLFWANQLWFDNTVVSRAIRQTGNTWCKLKYSAFLLATFGGGHGRNAPTLDPPLEGVKGWVG